MFDMNRANDRYIFYVERFHRFDNELQSNSELLHVTGFLRVIYPILNASVILERNETQLARNEKRLERNETRIARNETRGGNLLLSGTVVNDVVPNKSEFTVATCNFSQSYKSNTNS